MSDFSQITLDVHEQIATITLQRPDAMNAFTGTMLYELLDAFDRTDADDEVRAVIMTGAGERAFCAGADLSAGGETFHRDDASDDEVPRDGGGLVALRMFESRKPIIGAFNGAAVGVGITMMLPADVRIAAEHARFGFVFARRGIVCEAASSWFLPRIVGIEQALRWAYSGRVFGAGEALEHGLVSEVIPAERLIERARAIAHDLVLQSAPVSVALTRALMWRMLGADHPMRAHQADSRAMHSRGRSADATEGIESFLAKRNPTFTDRVSDGLPDIFERWPAPDFC